jgi:archaellum component FlaD/FlaE
MGKKDEEEEEFVIDSSTKVSSGEVKKYEVRVTPPSVSGGRKVRPVREGTEEAPAAGSAQGGRTGSKDAPPIAGAAAQQVFKIEDDLRRTREVVEDLKHTSSILQGDVRDLKAEMERINYLLKSLEGLRNSLKDIETTVSELSGLYDMISANINPFIDIPPMRTKSEPRSAPVQQTKGQSSSYVDPSDVFGSAEEEIVDDSSLESDEWILRWIKYLTDKVGTHQLGRTLDYYRRMNWIDETIIQRINEASKGTTAPEKYVEFDGEDSWRLDPEDHIKSLEFIKKIKGDRR